MTNPFLINRLRQNPVSYTVRFDHFVADGQWTIGVFVEGVNDDQESRKRVLEDLRRAVAMFEKTIAEGLE